MAMTDPYEGDYKPYTGDSTFKALGTMTNHGVTYQRIPTHNGRFYAALVRAGGILKTTRSRLQALWWRMRYRRYEYPG